VREFFGSCLQCVWCYVIHPAFQICPSEHQFWCSCFIEPVSDWAFLQMITELDQRSADAVYNFYSAIGWCPNYDTLERMMLETKLHLFLCCTIDNPWTFTIQSLNDRSTTTLDIEFSSNTQHLTFRTSQHFASLLASSVRSNKSCCLKLLSPVFQSFHSFLYQHGVFPSGCSPLIALQVVTSTHAMDPISIDHLEKVQKSLALQIFDQQELER
jgi:hypothetical protein